MQQIDVLADGIQDTPALLRGSLAQGQADEGGVPDRVAVTEVSHTPIQPFSDPVLAGPAQVWPQQGRQAGLTASTDLGCGVGIAQEDDDVGAVFQFDQQAVQVNPPARAPIQTSDQARRGHLDNAPPAQRRRPLAGRQPTGGLVDQSGLATARRPDDQRVVAHVTAQDTQQGTHGPVPTIGAFELPGPGQGSQVTPITREDVAQQVGNHRFETPCALPLGAWWCIIIVLFGGLTLTADAFSGIDSTSYGTF